MLDEVKRRVVAAVERVSPRAGALLTMRQPLSDVLPVDLADLDPHQEVPDRLIGDLGVDMRVEQSIARVERWGREYGELFASLRADAAINTEALGQGYLRNPYFATPDAEVYAAMIADHRPAAIVEVGGGFSTLVARRTIDHVGLETRLVVVDPQPRTDVARQADELVRERIEDVEPGRLPLGANAILFIDSSHVVRSRGDVPWLFNTVLPAAPAGAVVHVHDVFLPWDYPDVMRLRLYGEQYVLHALLSHSPRYRTLLAVHHLCRRHPEALGDALGHWRAQAPELYGGSFWFEVTSDP